MLSNCSHDKPGQGRGDHQEEGAVEESPRVTSENQRDRTVEQSSSQLDLQVPVTAALLHTSNTGALVLLTTANFKPCQFSVTGVGRHLGSVPEIDRSNLSRHGIWSYVNIHFDYSLDAAS